MGEIRGCVQCGLDFSVDENVPGSCRYHPVLDYTYGAWDCVLTCCGLKLSSYDPFPSGGCAKAAHADTHHEDFPYLNRLGHFRAVLRDSDVWATVEQDDISSACKVGARVGRLRDGETLAFWTQQDGITVALVQVPASELLAALVPPSLEVTQATTLLNDSWNKAVGRLQRTWHIHAEWVAWDVTSPTRTLRLSAKSPTGSAPNALEVSFHVEPLELEQATVVADDATSLSDVQPRVHRSYAFQPRCTAPNIPSALFDANRPALPVFGSSGSLPLRLKSTKPVVANDARNFNKADMFEAEFLVMNLMEDGNSVASISLSEERKMILQMVHDRQISVDEAERLLLATAKTLVAPATDATITLVDVACALSLDDGVTWTAAQGVTWDGQEALLLRLSRGDVLRCKAEALFAAPTKTGQWRSRSFLTRMHATPARLRWTVESAAGDTCTVETAFMNPPLEPLPALNPVEDWFFASLDVLADFSRLYVRIQRPTPDEAAATPRVLWKVVCALTYTTTYTVTPTTVRTWCLEHQAVQSQPTMALANLSDAGKVEWTGHFDNESRLVGLCVKLLDGEVFAEDTWVVPWHEI
ncbi:hypothetical protein ACHHYP_12448 [Achlya hypogyna]|uniref:Uncharacterized protein n=1 Tax=Achlya hypogyna TaxID=1202772 RepID=A0A1V9YGZ0_ACHHY|nr:hypothetical protein ACHHYP_12448 [Achlya hypogyna]